VAAEQGKSLEFCALGLGQAGGNLAAEFHRLGYRAAALNTAQVDLRGLDAAGLKLPEKSRFYVGLDGLDGAGKDPAYGRACLKEHADSIRDFVGKELSDCDVLFLCAGLGGGTGSCVGDLYEILEPLDLPLAVLATLPSESESGIVKVNAVRAVSDLVDRPLLARIFVDNQRLISGNSDVDLLSYYPQVNRAILAPLHALNTLNQAGEHTSLRSFDSEDLRKVLLSGGVVVIGTEDLDLVTGIEASELEEAVRKQTDGGSLLAPGLALDQIAYAGVVLIAPESILKETPVRALEELGDKLKQETKGGALYLGLYVADVSFPVLHVVAGSLTLPERVRELLKVAREEGHLLADKVQAEIPPLDLGDLVDMQLFKITQKRRAAIPAPGKKSRPSARADSADKPPKKDRPEELKPAASESKRGRSKAERKADKDKEEPVLRSRVEMPLELEPEPELLPEPDLEPEPEPELEPDAPVASPMSAMASTSADVTAPKPREPALVPEVTAEAAIDDLEIGDEAPAQEDLQDFYGQQIDSFRENQDRRVREKIARRLIIDAKAEDPEVRAHAVWAMVSIGERGFKGALSTAMRDPDPEIRSLAADGLRRLGEPVE